jgi:hypothetical protein
MQISFWTVRLIAAALAMLMAGCQHSFTYKLWQTDEFRHVRERATNSNVAVFYAPARKDFLISYNSVRDGGDGPRRLNYFLGENRGRIFDRKKPAFVSTNHLTLNAVPINQGTNSTPAAKFEGMLIIYTDKGQIGPYPLPTYEEGSGTAVQVALTPLAVTGDVVCVSAILAMIGAYAYAGGCWHCGH